MCPWQDSNLHPSPSDGDAHPLSFKGLLGTGQVNQPLNDDTCPVVPLEGFEPSTFPLRAGSSGRLSYRGKSF